MVDPATHAPPIAGGIETAAAAPIRPNDGWSAQRLPYRRAYAALDLGTNNCRLLIARPEGNRFSVIDAFSRIVRLGEGMASSGMLSEAAMDRAVSALSVCAEKLVRRNVHMARSVATEACRRAGNGPEFVARVYRETGIKLDVIAPREEARLAVVGCHALLEPGEGTALIFDIGGGSTELVLVDTTGDTPQTLDWLSAPWGVVSLSEAVPHDAADPVARAQAYNQMRARVAEAFAPLKQRNAGNGAHPRRLLGTSGTVTTLASVYLQLPHYDRKQIDGLHVETCDMREICRLLAGQSVAERAAWPCIGTERADLVVAGCAILESIFDIWPAERVGIADRGIREGILRQLMASDRRR
jgi:exopolyphosphatase / guanosine-5'-triphosphate,3'-diphosphate pyrophosphatase